MSIDLANLEVVEVIDLARKEHSSRTHPDLPNKPGGPDNWVEKVGGLPSYIKRIAKHIFYDSPGMTVSHAIAAAVERVKVLAAKGNAQAIKALAEWEAKRGRSHAQSAAKKVSRKLSDEGGQVVDLALLQQKRGVKYSTFGNSTSALSTGVKGASYDENKHARTSGGQFANKLNPSELIAAKRRVEANLANLRPGQTLKLPGDVGWVKRTAGGFFVQGNGGFVASVRTLSEAVVAAATLLVKKGFKG